MKELGEEVSIGCSGLPVVVLVVLLSVERLQRGDGINFFLCDFNLKFTDRAIVALCTAAQV